MLVVVGLRTTFLASASFVTHQQEHGGVRPKPGIWISGDGDIDEVDKKVEEELDDVDDDSRLTCSSKKMESWISSQYHINEITEEDNCADDYLAEQQQQNSTPKKARRQISKDVNRQDFRKS